MSIFQRVASWLANEVITKSLAKSETFQRFAATTHKHVSKVQSQAAEATKDLKVEIKPEEVKAAADGIKHKVTNNSFIGKIKKTWAELEAEGKALEEKAKAKKQ
eukprot:m.337345 g.337345  ORF g.337345 m.337345 type:complete len:104 (-) comp18105_c0_seq1:140-451(-)